MRYNNYFQLVTSGWDQDNFRFLSMRVCLWSIIESNDSFTRVQYPPEVIHNRKFNDKIKYPNGIKINQNRY